MVRSLALMAFECQYTGATRACQLPQSPRNPRLERQAAPRCGLPLTLVALPPFPAATAVALPWSTWIRVRAFAEKSSSRGAGGTGPAAARGLRAVGGAPLFLWGSRPRAEPKRASNGEPPPRRPACPAPPRGPPP